jgi:PPOX class probable FMN-dependent enzyme
VTPGDDHVLGDEAALRARYRAPHELVLRKQQAEIDDGARAFIGASPFAVLASTSPSGTDASPRGGPPGFVAVLDRQRLAFGDLAGNNRLDSYANITSHPEVGLLFFVPGVEELLRVNGRAHLTTDPDMLDRTPVGGVRPKVAVVVTVTECFIHCGKALRRSGLWDRNTWPAGGEAPSAAAILTGHLRLDTDPATVAADLEAGYRATLWRQGGEA